MTCDNCQLAEDNHGHRCRANESSCIDGTDCPDYIEQCDCKQCVETDQEYKDRKLAILEAKDKQPKLWVVNPGDSPYNCEPFLQAYSLEDFCDSFNSDSYPASASSNGVYMYHTREKAEESLNEIISENEKSRFRN